MNFVRATESRAPRRAACGSARGVTLRRPFDNAIELELARRASRAVRTATAIRARAGGVARCAGVASSDASLARGGDGGEDTTATVVRRRHRCLRAVVGSKSDRGTRQRAWLGAATARARRPRLGAKRCRLRRMRCDGGAEPIASPLRLPPPLQIRCCSSRRRRQEHVKKQGIRLGAGHSPERLPSSRCEPKWRVRRVSRKAGGGRDAAEQRCCARSRSRRRRHERRVGVCPAGERATAAYGVAGFDRPMCLRGARGGIKENSGRRGEPRASAMSCSGSRVTLRAAIGHPVGPRRFSRSLRRARVTTANLFRELPAKQVPSHPPSPPRGRDWCSGGRRRDIMCARGSRDASRVTLPCLHHSVPRHRARDFETHPTIPSRSRPLSMAVPPPRGRQRLERRFPDSRVPVRLSTGQHARRGRRTALRRARPRSAVHAAACRSRARTSSRPTHTHTASRTRSRTCARTGRLPHRHHKHHQTSGNNHSIQRDTTTYTRLEKQQERST